MSHSHPIASTSTKAKTTPIPGEVNVILRGLFLLSQSKAGIEVLIPNMGPEHVYRTGGFLNETSLAPMPYAKPYQLFGVERHPVDPAIFPRDVNIVLRGYPTDEFATPEDLHARILLPPPHAITSLRPMVDGFEAEQDAFDLVDGNKTCGVQVLHYRSPDIQKVYLSGHPNLVPFPEGAPKYANLHVVSEPEAAFSQHHVQQGFDRLINLMPSLRGAIKITKASGLRQPQGDPDKGIAHLETYTLPEASDFLRHAWALWRVGSDVPPPTIGAWPDEACTPLIVDQTPS
jgi:hypothetical protein